jgi:hypothetical protein
MNLYEFISIFYHTKIFYVYKINELKLINKSGLVGFINFWIRKKLLKFALNICRKKRNKTEIKSDKKEIF